MKLYEFVDRLYAMGDMESPKAAESKKTLNESLAENVDESGITQDKINKTLQVLIDNGIDEDEAEIVLQAIGYTLLDKELFPEDDLDEGILGGLAGAALGGAIGNGLEIGRAHV